MAVTKAEVSGVVGVAMAVPNGREAESACRDSLAVLEASQKAINASLGSRYKDPEVEIVSTYRPR